MEWHIGLEAPRRADIMGAMTKPPGALRDILVGIFIGAIGVLVAWMINLLAARVGFGATTGAWAHAAAGLLAFGLLVRHHDRCGGTPARILVAIATVLSGWNSLIAATFCWFDTLQHQPNPPPEAFADGAALTGVMMAGWVPPLAAFMACRLFVFIRRRAFA